MAFPGGGFGGGFGEGGFGMPMMGGRCRAVTHLLLFARLARVCGKCGGSKTCGCRACRACREASITCR